MEHMHKRMCAGPRLLLSDPKKGLCVGPANQPPKPTHIRNVFLRKNEIYYRGRKLEADYWYTYFVLASEPPPTHPLEGRVPPTLSTGLAWAQTHDIQETILRGHSNNGLDTLRTHQMHV